MDPQSTDAWARADEADRVPRALVVDWGGVLTNSLGSAMEAWAADEDLDLKHFGDLMSQWFGPSARSEAGMNPVHLLERGEMEVPDFERALAGGLGALASRPVEPEGLLDRLFSQFRDAHDMNALVRRARQGGVRTAMLSNSWGNDYPNHVFDGMFDVVVISGHVGMRKPEERIYFHTASELGVAPPECVFVDDLEPNVRAATEIGMIGIHHVDYDDTASQLEALFGRWLRP